MSIAHFQSNIKSSNFMQFKNSYKSHNILIGYTTNNLQERSIMICECRFWKISKQKLFLMKFFPVKRIRNNIYPSKSRNGSGTSQVL